jgi:hypothetical protein
VHEGWDDDERLMEALSSALRARQAVPPWFLETAKSAYAWHSIDAELAQLTYDSSRDAEVSASLRAESASIRALTFTSAHLTIELEIGDTALLGQIMPPRPGMIEAQTQAGATTPATVDEIGCFSIEPMPPGPFRLHCHTEDGTDVVTGWVTL